MGPVSYTHLDVYKRQPVLRFIEFEALNHRAHGTIEHHDAFLQNLGQRLRAGVGACSHSGLL